MGDKFDRQGARAIYGDLAGVTLAYLSLNTSPQSP
jgi:hypothetical protein